MRPKRMTIKKNRKSSFSLASYSSLEHLQEEIRQGSTSCIEQLNQYLEKIKANQELNIFIETFDQSAMLKAEEVDKKFSAGQTGKLAGLIVAIKDNLCYENHGVSASSRMLENFNSLYSSTVVNRLIKEDAIIIGRTNCDEFAMGSSNETSYYGTVKNPLNQARVAGGSSGGSAAAVAAGLCMASLGSDTGGSIRQPASFCGVVGLKPTYGRVSRHGLIAFASSFDQIGPITRNIEDSAKILEVIAGPDEFDSTLSKRPTISAKNCLNDNKKSYKVAYFDCYTEHDGISKDIKEKTQSIIDGLKSEGHQVDKVSFTYLDQLVPAYYVLTTAEASSNLARYDGIHFGYRSEAATDLESTYLKSRSEGFGKEVKRRIMLGTYVLSSGYYDAYYEKAQKVRRLVKETTDKVFENYDFILSPTTPHSAFKIGAQKDDQIKMYLEDIFTVQAPLAGIPAISLPLGQDFQSLPFGIQLMGRPFEEEEMLAFSKYLMNNF